MTIDTDTNAFEARALSAYSGELYANRIAWGEDALATNPDRDANDDETVASDTISNILTALYGPSGVMKGDDTRVRHDAESKARVLIERAFYSWQGDSEDYSEGDED